METIIICVLATFSAVMLFLRATAAKTKNTYDDRVLAALEKVEPLVEALKPKAPAPPPPAQ